MSKISRFTILALAVAAMVVPAAMAQNISEGFENIGALGGGTWDQINHSTTIGSTNWFQGNPAVFPAQAGATNAYIGANFNNTTGTNTISNWLILPTRTLSNFDTLSFWTRTVSAPAFPDRLQVRQSLNGGSSNIGVTANDVGDFTTLLLDINSSMTTTGYPNAWTQFTINLSGIGAPTNGRLALRYFTPNGGPSGANSDYIGIDTLTYTQVPEPASLALLGLGSLALIRRRR